MPEHNIKIRVGVVKWTGNHSVVDVLTLDGAQIEKVFDGDRELKQGEDFLVAEPGAAIPRIEWTRKGEQPKPIELSIALKRPRGERDWNQVIVAVIAATGVLGSAILGYFATTFKSDRDSFVQIAERYGCKENATTKSKCLEEKIENLSKEQDAANIRLADLMSARYRLVHESEQVAMVIAKTRRGCKVGQGFADCLGEVLEERGLLAKRLGCSDPNSKDFEGCVTNKLRGVAP